MLDNERLAQKQAELSKALSAAYLNHQISELESQVRQLPLSQDAPVVNGHQHGNGTGIKQVAGDHHPIDVKLTGRIDDEVAASAPKQARQARIDDDNTSERDLDHDEMNDKEDWRVAVVDVSGLMWAPKAVRSLVARGFEVVVPADGLRTLDLLKKGNTPSAIAARSAARYIEHVSRQYKLLSADPQVTVQLGTNYKRGVGLRIQRDDEFRKADELSSLPLMPGEEGPPKWVKSVLGCAAFFAGINKAELEHSFSPNEIEPKPVLYVANPPLAVELAQATNGIGPETKEMRDHAESNGIFLERGEGVVVLQEAERFELGLEVLRDEDDESGYDLRRSGGRGRGRGKGPGGTGGPGPGGDRARTKTFRVQKEEEKQPEVKILLRRQQPTAEQPLSGPELTDNSPMSIVSPLPDFSGETPSGLLLSTHANANGQDDDKRQSSEVSRPMLKTDSFGSGMSSDISPPRRSAKPLPLSGVSTSERKSPASKFVPLTRETHPVRRQATSSDSDDSTGNHHQSGGGRGGRGGRIGGGTGGRGGRGGGGGATGGGRKRGKARDRDTERERDPEFKNGNFTLLQRPTPAPAPEPKQPPPSAPAPASTPKSQARQTPTVRPPKSPAVQGPKAPVFRSILARPPRGGPPGVQNGPHTHAPPHGRPPPPPGPPSAFAPDIRGRGRGGRGGSGFRPPPRGHPHGPGRGGHHHVPPPPSAPPPRAQAPVDGFEFDDAMLRPGYGSTPHHHDAKTTMDASVPAFRRQARAPAPGPGPGPDFGHHPQHHGHGQGSEQPPAQGYGNGYGYGYGYGQPNGNGGGNGYPPNWRPAPEKSSIVVLQRPK